MRTERELPPEDLKDLGRAFNSRTKDVVRISGLIADLYHPSRAAHIALFTGSFATLLFFPINLLTLLVSISLMMGGYLLLARRYKTIAALLVHATAILDGMGPEGSLVLVEALKEGPRTNPASDVADALRRLRTSSTRSDCSSGHVPNCAHRPVLPDAAKNWWPLEMIEAMGGEAR